MQRYIVYLEATGALQQALQLELNQTLELYGPTEAHQYHPHCSVTGFFEWPLEDEQRLAELFRRDLALARAGHRNEWPRIDGIEGSSGFATSMDSLLSAASSTSSVGSVASQTRSLGCSVRVVLTAPKWVHAFAQSFRNSAGCGVRLKPIDHFSLAYMASYPLVGRLGDHSLFKSSKAETDPSESVAHTAAVPPVVLFRPNLYYEHALSSLKLDAPSHGWRLALYRQSPSTVVFVPHSFSEICAEAL